MSSSLPPVSMASEAGIPVTETIAGNGFPASTVNIGPTNDPATKPKFWVKLTTSLSAEKSKVGVILLNERDVSIPAATVKGFGVKQAVQENGTSVPMPSNHAEIELPTRVAACAPPAKPSNADDSPCVGLQHSMPRSAHGRCLAPTGTTCTMWKCRACNSRSRLGSARGRRLYVVQ